MVDQTDQFKRDERERVTSIVLEILGDLLTTDRYTFQKHLQIFDKRNIQLGLSTGTEIGTETDQKIGFWGKTPVDQPDTVADPAGQADDLDTEARAAIVALIDRLQELGLIA